MDLNLAVLLVEPAAFLAGLAVLRIPVTLLRERRLAVVLALAAVSGLLAATAGPSPTGWVPLDVLLLGGLGTTAVLAGSQAPSPLILLGGLVCAAAGFGSVGLPLALAGVGLVLVSLLIEAEPVVDAAAGGLVVQAALRLSSPGTRGLTALIAAVALLPLLLSAARTLAPPHRRLLVRMGSAAAAFAIVGAITGALAAATAAAPLRRGVSEAAATLDGPSTSDLHTTGARLAKAGRHFARARRALDAWWAWPARAVPVVGPHWRVLHAAAASGDDLAASARRALAAPALGDVQVVDGRFPLDQVVEIEPPVADLATQAADARRRLDDARSGLLLPPLWDRLDRNMGRVEGIARTTGLAHRVLTMLPRLLGGDGFRRYLLIVQTPAESRAGGGFIGNFGEITAEDGRLTLARFGRHDELTFAPGRSSRTLVAPPDFVARYERFQPHREWVNVNLSPDFPTDAQVMADLYPQSGGAPVDGVIAMDPAALAALLGVIGPVEVPSWPVPITADNALKTLLLDQYERSDTRAERVGFLGDVAQAAWGRLTSGSLPPLPQLVNAMGPVVRTKHIFLWSGREDEQRLFEDVGASGKVAPVTGDFAGLVTQSAVGNKTDNFLRRELSYRVRLNPGNRRLEASVRVVLHNDAPSEGLDHGVIGNDLEPRLPSGTNKLLVSFYSPWELRGGAIDGQAVAFESATELGRRVYSVTVVIPSKSQVVIEMALSGRLSAADGYRLDLHRQPVVAPDDVTTVLRLDGGWRTAGGRREQTTALRLDLDATVEVDLRRPWP